MEIQKIKQRLSILSVLSHYGLRPDKHGLLCCPFHEDKTPSLKVYEKTNTFHCFGCGATGDTIEFIQLKENTSKHGAILKATELTGDVPPTNDRPANQPKQAPAKNQPGNKQILARAFAYFQNAIKIGKAEKPRQYLQSRGLDPGLLEIGYNPGKFHHRGHLSGADKQACVAAGLLAPYHGNIPNATGAAYTPFAKGCTIFPLKGKNGDIVSLYGRAIANNNKSKHYYLKNRQGLYPGHPSPNTTRLILAEAIIDAATLVQLKTNNEGFKNYEILACYGTNGLTEEHKAAIKGLQHLQEIIFFFDGDKAGNEAAQKYATELVQTLHCNVSIVNTPEGEDINSLLQGHPPEIFPHLLETRKPASGRTSSFLLNEKENVPHPGVQTLHATSQQGKLNTRNPDYITYTTEYLPGGGQGLQITILGGINLQQMDRLRTTLKISRTGTGDPLHSIRHTLDLYHTDYLEKFINKASEQLETGTTIIKRAIAELTEQIEQYRLSKIESMKELKPRQRQLTEQRYKKAINYLKAPNLMERTNNDIGKTGMVGEETNRLLMYLVFTSRLREQPLHIISLGASGTGKTYLQEKISELVPEQDKLEITILSENAFYYFDRKELKQKLVLIEDMDGAENVLYPLRELQTKRKISKTVPIKDSKGNLKTITLHVEGPISLAGTTTRERLFEDNSNRSLLIYLDNSHGHKEKIMEYQRKLSAGKIDTKAENGLKEFFKDMQTVLKPIQVRNPYAELLKLPGYVFKPLRTNAHYLATIEAITFYCQYQREVKTGTDGGQYIETALEDIEWANKLLKDVLLAKSDELSGECRGFFERLKGWIKSGQKASFFASQVREAFRMNPSNLKYYLVQLVRYGYIKPVGGDRYKRGYEYEVVNFGEYDKLNTSINSVFDETLQEIKNKTSGQRGQHVDNYANYPPN